MMETGVPICLSTIPTPPLEHYCEAIHTQEEADFKVFCTCEPTNVEISGTKLYQGIDEVYDKFLTELIGGAHESIALVNDGLTAYQLTDDVTVACLFCYHTECIRRGTGEPHGIACLETQVLKRVEGTWKIADPVPRQGHQICRVKLAGAIAMSSPSQLTGGLGF